MEQDILEPVAEQSILIEGNLVDNGTAEPYSSKKKIEKVVMAKKCFCKEKGGTHDGYQCMGQKIYLQRIQKSEQKR